MISKVGIYHHSSHDDGLVASFLIVFFMAGRNHSFAFVVRISDLTDHSVCCEHVMCLFVFFFSRSQAQPFFWYSHQRRGEGSE